MNFDKLLAFTIFCTTISAVSAQSKKDIRENKIISETSNITAVENGKEVTYKDSYIVYDKNGNVTEETEYNKDGSIKRKETNKYNANKDKTEEMVFDGKDKTTHKTTFFYNSGGQKIGEIEYDGDGKILKQSMIIYNANGFKTEKKTYDANKKLISTKKFTYSK
jgi:hypothetical protein